MKEIPIPQNISGITSESNNYTKNAKLCLDKS